MVLEGYLSSLPWNDNKGGWSRWNFFAYDPCWARSTVGDTTDPESFVDTNLGCSRIRFVPETNAQHPSFY